MHPPQELQAESATYRQLRDELSRLQAQPAPDMAAIDKLIAALAEEQLRLKALDGQPGNNPIPELGD